MLINASGPCVIFNAYKCLINASGTCDLSERTIRRRVCQPRPHKNPETHTKSRRDPCKNSRRDSHIYAETHTNLVEIAYICTRSLRDS